MSTFLRYASALLTTIVLIVLWVVLGVSITYGQDIENGWFAYVVLAVFIAGILATWALAYRPILPRYVTWLPWLLIVAYILVSFARSL